jgi:hypothetical protein
MQRSRLQNAKFSAMVGDVADARYLGPWKRAFAREAYKRWFLAKYCREARMEAYANGWADPFPDLVARSSELDAEQFNELIECTMAYAATCLGLKLK